MSASQVRNIQMPVEIGVDGHSVNVVINGLWWQPACFGKQLNLFHQQLTKRP
jgi:hypothetical protein